MAVHYPIGLVAGSIHVSQYADSYLSHPENKLLNLSSVAANSSSITPMARRAQRRVTWAVPISRGDTSRLSCLSFVTAMHQQPWPLLPLSALWTHAHTSLKSAARLHVVELP